MEVLQQSFFVSRKGRQHGVPYGSHTALDPTNHDGEIEARDILIATCHTEGYSGNLCCSGCNQVISYGSTIDIDPANHDGEEVLRDVLAAIKLQEGFQQLIIAFSVFLHQILINEDAGLHNGNPASSLEVC